MASAYNVWWGTGLETMHGTENVIPTHDTTGAHRIRRATRRRGAAIYVLTLMVAMLVTGTAGTLLAMQMANRRLHRNVSGARQAELFARGGVEWALAKYQSDIAWRSTAVSGAITRVTPEPGAFVDTALTDVDGDFTDDDTEAAVVTVAADVDGAVFKMSASLDPQPHETLARAIYATGKVSVLSATTVRGPVHASGGFSNFASINTSNDASFTTYPSGTVFGIIPKLQYVDSVEPFPAPGSGYYTVRATPLTSVGITFDLIGVSLSETFNTTGGLVNPEGVYHINAGNRAVNIQNVFLRGTLIITNIGPNSVTIGGRGCRFERGTAGYPTLLVYGGSGDLMINPGGGLDESVEGYDVNQDGDVVDVLPSGIFGAMWTDRFLTTLGGTDVTYQGSIIARWVVISGSVTIDDDPALAGLLVPSFTDNKLHLRRGSIREVSP